MVELSGAGELDVQVREALIHIEGRSARNLVEVSPGFAVLAGEFVDASVGKERLEFHLAGCRRRHKFVLDHHLV